MAGCSCPWVVQQLPAVGARCSCAPLPVSLGLLLSSPGPSQLCHPAAMATAAAKAPPAHPPYLTMIVAAIKALKERTGSSAPAIAKYIGANYKVPAGFEKTLSQQLKRLAVAGKLVRVKASFKLSEELKVRLGSCGVRRVWTGTGILPGRQQQRRQLRTAPHTHAKPQCALFPKQKPAKKAVKKPAAKKPATKASQEGHGRVGPGWWQLGRCWLPPHACTLQCIGWAECDAGPACLCLCCRRRPARRPARSPRPTARRRSRLPRWELGDGASAGMLGQQPVESACSVVPLLPACLPAPPAAVPDCRRPRRRRARRRPPRRPHPPSPPG